MRVSAQVRTPVGQIIPTLRADDTNLPSKTLYYDVASDVLYTLIEAFLFLSLCVWSYGIYKMVTKIFGLRRLAPYEKALYFWNFAAVAVARQRLSCIMDIE